MYAWSMEEKKNIQTQHLFYDIFSSLVFVVCLEFHFVYKYGSSSA